MRRLNRLRNILKKFSHEWTRLPFSSRSIHSFVLADAVECRFRPTKSDIQAIALPHKTQGGNNGEVEYDNIRFETGCMVICVWNTFQASCRTVEDVCT
jgi:hypothetical protein